MRSAPAKSATSSPLAIGLAAAGPDLVDDLAGGAGAAPAAVELGAEVVDHDLGALAGELEGVRPAEPPARAGHDDDPSVADAAHARQHDRI